MNSLLKESLKTLTKNVDLRKKAEMNINGETFDLGIITRLVRALPQDFEVVHENQTLHFSWSEGRGIASINNSEKVSQYYAEEKKKETLRFMGATSK